MTRAKQLLAAAAVAAATGAACIAISQPSYAGATPNTASECENYLFNKGYTVGTKIINACTEGAGGNEIGCNLDLVNAGVSSGAASTACELADR